MNKEKIYRIIDANINRASEGLRVIEDIIRFVFNDQELSTRIKKIRHQIRNLANQEEYIDLLKSRNAEKDVEKHTTILNPSTDPVSIIIANFKRTEEALRVIEELSKIIKPDIDTVNQIEGIRFIVYDMEKEIVIKIKQNE